MNVGEAIRRIRVHCEHVARLGIDDDYGAFLALKLLGGIGLQITVYRHPDIFIFGFRLLVFGEYVPGLRHRVRIAFVEHAFQARGAALIAQEMRHFPFKRIGAYDAAVTAKLVVRKRCVQLARPVQHPPAQARSVGSPVAEVFIADRLKLVVVLIGKFGPIDLKAVDKERQYHKHRQPNTEAAVCGCLRQPPPHLARQAPFKCKHRPPQIL